MRRPSARFSVSDGEDVSTAELLRRMAQAQGRSALAVAACRPHAGRPGAGKAGLPSVCAFPQVDSAATCRQLDWRPPLTLDEGLRRVGGELHAAYVRYSVFPLGLIVRAPLLLAIYPAGLFDTGAPLFGRCASGGATPSPRQFRTMRGRLLRPVIWRIRQPSPAWAFLRRSKLDELATAECIAGE